MRKAIFIDKDGTLITDIPYNVDPSRICLAPGATTAVRQWNQQGYLVIGISNQSGIARGFFGEAAMRDVFAHINTLLKAGHAYLDAFYYCPHHPDGTVKRYAYNCSCRKPKPGLITNAAKLWNIDLTESWMIGDILHDVEAGNRAGCRTILINNGNETVWHLDSYRVPTAVVDTLTEAAQIILKPKEHYA
jgi:D-glycero-D-manno-heptose 1,7-bisphosphate phosphatase